jgi:hypothetical protein
MVFAVSLYAFPLTGQCFDELDSTILIQPDIITLSPYRKFRSIFVYRWCNRLQSIVGKRGPRRPVRPHCHADYSAPSTDKRSKAAGY